MHINITK